ncbi:adenylosuccinate synthase [bacterium]|nr:adenylosuccinate synthase [bacterium]
MQSIAIIGSQWGDEGKGKITDLLSQKCDLVVRYQGGNNAGHTIIVGDKKTVLHLIPSGILHPHCVSIIGHGVVFDPRAFVHELSTVQGVEVTGENLKISNNVNIITSYHKILDAVRESQGPQKIGTTGKGIGPAYEDKASRKGIKLKDLFNKDTLRNKLQKTLTEKEVLFNHLYKTEVPPLETELEELYAIGQEIKHFSSDTFSILDQAFKDNKKILYEGAQGILLDVDYGSYPYVTSSSTSYGGIYTGAGVPGKSVDEVIGITKAYTTRVGEGPFPTELNDSTGEFIQNKGHEFGATTGRKRRCGWLDLPLLKYTCKASNLTSLALTKVDILSGMDELKVCYAYEYEGREIDCAYPGIDLEKVVPLYKDLTPFKDDFKSELSVQIKSFIETVEKAVEVPVGIIAFGPEREEIKFLKDYFS